MNSLSKSTRNRFIDVLKGVCMILIILTHVPWEDGEYNRFLFAFWRDMAVPILMIISGYVYSLSFSRKGISTLSDAYAPRSWLPALVRYTLPFAIFYVAELILIIFIRKTPTTLLACLKMFLHGGHGAGSYYYPVLVQFIFLFPVLYFMVQKYKRNGFFLCLGLNAIFELLQWGYNMDGEFYRLMIFRYITVIAYGCYLATADYKPSKPLCFASLGAGALFITLVYYFSYEPKIIRYWLSTCFIACLFILPITMLMIKKCRFGCPPLELIGKASYHIFLAQMFYFYTCSDIYAAIENRWLEMGASLAITIIGGIVFYLVSQPIEKLCQNAVRSLIKKAPASNQNVTQS